MNAQTQIDLSLGRATDEQSRDKILGYDLIVYRIILLHLPPQQQLQLPPQQGL